MPLSPNLRAAAFMSISMAGFTVNDAISKLASESMNMGQVMLVRGLFATAFVAVLAWQQGALRAPMSAFHPTVALRVFCEAAATVAFLIALAHLPIATVSAILQALPLAVTMAAALFLGETVRWRRWLAISVGFVGVMIIVRPGADGFNTYALLALLSVGFCAIRDLATRSIPKTIPTLFVSTVTAVVVTLFGAVLVVPMGGWKPIDAGTTAMIAFGAVMLLFGYQFIIMAMRTGQISFVAPFRYTALVWSLALGFLIFGDVPDGPMIVGALIVVGSGIYALYREQRAGRGHPAADSIGPAMAPDGL